MLLIPGPTEISERVTKAITTIPLFHNDELVVRKVEETRELLEPIFQTSNDIVVIPGTGRSGMESAISSVLEPGDSILIIVNGFFANWFVDIASRIQAKVTLFESPYGKPIDLEALEKVLQYPFKAVALVHSETSTGSYNSVDKIGKLVKASNALFIVDAVSSVGGMDVHVDDWNIDICITAAQKCLGAVLGLAAISISDRAWQHMSKRSKPCTSYTLDLLRWKRLWIDSVATKAYPAVLPPILIAALNEATKEVLAEGLPHRFQRHRDAAFLLRKGLADLGINLFSDELCASNTATAFYVPVGFQGKQIVDELISKHDITIAQGMGDLRSSILRVGHMANTAKQETMNSFLQALKTVLYH